jgi:uncharacterized protein YoxC
MFLGDYIFGIAIYLVPLLFISLIILYFRNAKKSREQLQRIEEELKKLNSK